ncbi:DUF2975 domain-containing protein [Flavobacterium sp. xlx-214]|uniref:DUF2975 domain-containing protein n=1 Tax=unclassified Flavobacterium TaxID=196869 RepID=UPI0013D0DECC|nr:MULTISPECIES: DUF2975 domain-containing protein [unclassified Flavobacterium]MBA5793213.1 DUF2975 domain-containing protein [Flavobacterium sp. xlx-221]QMI82504.1 DUF2975 domain-containing protein [Flavobacterium sp. xlx-214]
MRTITFLNIVIRIIFGFLVLLTSFITISFLLYAFNINLGFNFLTRFSSNINTPLSNFLIIVIGIMVLIYAVSYIYALYLFRKCLDLFMEMKFFENTIIKNFKTIGYIFLIGFVVNCLFKYFEIIEKANLQKSVPINFSFTNLFLNPFNGLIISLFFIVLSKVFQLAKQQKEENITLKQENDLTI